MNPDLVREIQGIFVETFELEPKLVTPNARLNEDLGLDSLDAVDLIVAIEKRYGITVDDKAAKQLRRVEDVASYVATLIASNSPR